MNTCNTKNKIVQFFKNLAAKVDRKMGEKAQKKSCCSGSGDNKDNKCCS